MPLPGVRVVRSQSAFGFSMIYVIFEDNVDLYFARSRVLERMSLITKTLPAGVTPTLGPDATQDARLQATTRTLLHGGITLENVGPRLGEMRPHGDWIGVNGNRPPFSGFQMGFTGFTRRPR